MENLIQDLKHGARLLARRPGFTAVAVASLALGVGLNTTFFSVVNAVLLRGTPVADPERLVEIYSSQHEDYPYLTTSYPDYLSLREGTTAFSGLMAHTFVRGILSTGGQPAVTTGESVTSNYFEVLGLQPALGRGFRADENVAEGQHPVVVLSHALWQRRFGGRPDVLGQPVELSGVSYTAPTRIGAMLLGAFGMLALLLAAVGLYGVIAYSVSMRTRELGVRMALGARPREVLGLVLGQGARLAAIGIGAGALLAALVGRVLGSLLYGVSALDPVAYALAATILLAVAGVATLVPALTAARVDPLRALRAD